MMKGELPRLSNRAKRRLPRSFLGRVFLTWFNPGPATGYLFAISNLLWRTTIYLFLGAVVFREIFPERATQGILRSLVDLTDRAKICLLIFAYVALYLGLGKLLVGMLRRFSPYRWESCWRFCCRRCCGCWWGAWFPR